MNKIIDKSTFHLAFDLKTPKEKIIIKDSEGKYSANALGCIPKNSKITSVSQQLFSLKNLIRGENDPDEITFYQTIAKQLFQKKYTRNHSRGLWDRSFSAMSNFRKGRGLQSTDHMYQAVLAKPVHLELIHKLSSRGSSSQSLQIAKSPRSEARRLLLCELLPERTLKIDPFVYLNPKLNFGDEPLSEKARWKKIKELLKNSSTIEKIAALYPEIEKIKTDHNGSEAYINSLVHALVIKSLYSKTHYTFIHAQQLSFFILIQFIKELQKLELNQTFSLFHILRIPSSREKICMKDLDPEEIDDHNEFYQQKLLSLDGYFFNTTRGESAFFFGEKNTNVFDNIKPLIDQLLSHYLGKTDDILSAKLVKLSYEYQSKARIGNLIAISIQKQVLDETIYAANSGGCPASLYNEAFEKDKLPLLNQLQNDDAENLLKKFPSLKESFFDLGLFIQYRALIDQISAENSRIFSISQVPTAIKNQYKTQLKELAQLIFKRRQAQEESD